MNPFIKYRRARAEVRATVADDTATIRLYDPIDSWGGDWGISAKEFAAALDELGDVSELTLLVNCPGGDLWEGMAIYNTLRAHPARVTVIVEGLAASAASFIAMAGDHVVARPASEIMIHDAWIVGVGNAEALREIADRIDTESLIVAEIYAEKAGTPVDMWREAMRSEQWFTPAEALEAGLVDAVDAGVPERAELVSSARFNLSSFNYAGRRVAPAPSVAAARQEGETMSALMAGLRERLGITQDVTDAEALAALDEALAEQAAPEGEGSGDPVDAPADAEDGDESADESDDESDEAAGADESADDTVTLDAEVYADLMARAARGDEAADVAQGQAAAELVDAAIRDGKVLAAKRDGLIAAARDDMDAMRTKLASLASGTIPVSEKGRGGSDEAREADENRAVRNELSTKANAVGLFGPPKA
ncbi:MAG: ATP-dependent Clp protease proteolytic subunit [Propionibacteriaceae bacterium]|nr:ATP-dependent Clp protease proteolytic subunit [Propionibacteriaceae bacterium]